MAPPAASTDLAQIRDTGLALRRLRPRPYRPRIERMLIDALMLSLSKHEGWDPDTGFCATV